MIFGSGFCMSNRRRVDPWILLLVVVTAGPLAAGLGFMLLYSTGVIGLLASGFSLRYWARVLADGHTWISLAYSAWMGAISLGASLGLAFTLQAALGPRLRAGALRGLLFLPMAIPPLVAALLSVELLGNAGLVARLAHAAGWIERPEEFPTLLYTTSGVGIIFAHVTLVTPFLLLLLDRLARHESIAELEQVARTLGASRWQAWRRVRLPVLWRACTPVLSVYFLVLTGAYEVPLLVGAQYPSMISVLIQRRFSQFDLGTRPEAYALASIYACLAAGLLLVLFASRAKHRVLERAV
jgi:putative spermidine/putrescine transport system permease protein